MGVQQITLSFRFQLLLSFVIKLIVSIGTAGSSIKLSIESKTSKKVIHKVFMKENSFDAFISRIIKFTTKILNINNQFKRFNLK